MPVNMMEPAGAKNAPPKKNVTRTATAALVTWNVAAFAAVWALYYNRRIFPDNAAVGIIVAVALHYAIYLWTCDVYGAFSIASSKFADLALTHLLCFGIADFTLWAQGCVAARGVTNLLPGIATVAVQFAGTFAILKATKAVMRKVIVPAKSVIVYGPGVTPDDAETFRAKMARMEEGVYEFTDVIPEERAHFSTSGTMSEARNVVLYGVDPAKRYRLMRKCVARGKILFIAPTYEDMMTRHGGVMHFIDTPLLRYEYNYHYRRNHRSKRVFDFVVAAFFLAVFAPFMIVSAIAIKLEDGGPVFYRQKRVTIDGKTFDILKFRSMVVDAEKHGAQAAVGNDPRITKVGKIIRATRIDEAPQILNILKGDMSFVGPRPERVENVIQYEKEIPEFRNRLAVKGGLTGYAQVYGKYNSSARDKLLLDMFYIENQSLVMDVKLILLTIRTMFQAESTEGFDEEKSRELNEGAKEIGFGPKETDEGKEAGAKKRA